MVDSCALDVAERGGATLERVGELMNMTRERVRQIQDVALIKFESKAKNWRES
jgi:DNA-directed RNA polymerase sigma subunit (sigma70/sigma32)